jgi:hypothetical protein
VRLHGNWGGGDCYLSNVGNAGFQNEFRNHLATRIAAIPGADGFFFDNIELNYTSFGVPAAQEYPIDATTHRSPGWEAAYKSFLINVAVPLRSQGYYITGNAFGWCASCAGANNGDLNAAWWRYLTDANGRSLLSAFMVEHWMKPDASANTRIVGTASWTQLWDQFEQMQVVARSLGADFNGEDSAGSVGSLNPATVARFSRATFLMEYDCGRSSWVWMSTTDPWSTIDHTDVGCATGAKYQVAPNVWRRDFASGHYVCINPTGAAVSACGTTIASGDAVIH